MELSDYKAWYREEFGHDPGAKLIESFLKLHPQPKPPEHEPTPEEFWQEEPGPALPKFTLRRVDN